MLKAKSFNEILERTIELYPHVEECLREMAQVVSEKQKTGICIMCNSKIDKKGIDD